MKKKLLSVLLTTAMAASLLVGCGGDAASNDGAATGDDTAVTDDGAADGGEDAAVPATDDSLEKPAEDTGKTLNIYCWNDEFARRMRDHLSGYEVNDPEDATAGGKIGDVEVKFVVTPSDNNAYQDKLDQTLPGNADAGEDAVDIFLVEADYALKYVNTDLCLPVGKLGISVDELADQYQYTKDVMTDKDGNLKGLSWQGCPGTLIYNREAAKEVFGSDDPADVQAKVSDWATFNATAQEMKDAGYKMMATVNDSYRVYSNNVSTPWVVDGKIVVDDNIKAWVDASKEMADNDMASTESLWSDGWSAGFKPEGKVFCYFGPAWLINFCMGAGEEGTIATNGGWGACEGPQGFYWGGTWIAAANGTDNPNLVADIMRQLTTDKDTMLGIVKADSDFVNNVPAMNEAASDDAYAFDVFGGQNPLSIYCAGAEKISLSNITEYDQGCNEEFQTAMTGYFDGNYATYEEALDAFYEAVTTKYPELSY